MSSRREDHPRAWLASFITAAFLTLACQVMVAPPASAAMDRNWHYRHYNLDWVHSISKGAGVTIAVIDTQINISLPSFVGQDITAVGNFCPPSATGERASAVSTLPHAAHATSIVNALARLRTPSPRPSAQEYWS